VIPAPAISVSLSTVKAGARPVLATLRLHYEMQCGWPGPGSLVLGFPAGMLPARLAARGVLVNGKAATVARTSSSARELGVALPARPQIICDAIGPGTLTVVFTRAALLGNPRAAGSYVVRASHGADRLTGRFTIEP
jgi:hypothetical protein